MGSFFQSLPLWLNLLAFLVGFAVVIRGADWFVEGAVEIAHATGAPKILIGSTVVSLATTSPEVSVSFIAAILGRPATSVGNAVGSTICNIGLILAMAVIIQGIQTRKSTVRLQGLSMMAAGVALVILAWDGRITRTEGVALLAGTAAYLWFMARYLFRNDRNSGTGLTLDGWGLLIRQFLIGGICVVGGSTLIVHNATVLARVAGVSELIIGLTLVAFGTSLPECITAITSSLRGHGDIAAGNIIGANLLNITLVLGGSAAILPLGIEQQLFVLDFPVMLVLMLLVYILGGFRGGISRTGGFTFISIYAVYLVFLRFYFM